MHTPISQQLRGFYFIDLHEPYQLSLPTTLLIIVACSESQGVNPSTGSTEGNRDWREVVQKTKILVKFYRQHSTNCI